MQNLNNLSKEIYETNKLKGFDVNKCNIGQTLMSIVSELSEALEADRKFKHADLLAYERDTQQMNTYDDENSFRKLSFEYNVKDSFEDEITDVLIRTLDLIGAFQIDIDKHMKLKREYNSQRPHKHGKAY